MAARVSRLLKHALVLIAVVVLTVFVVRAFDSQRGPPLTSWQTYVPRELTAEELDRTDWPGYLRAEEVLFRDVRNKMRQELQPEERVPVNRYYEDSPLYPGRFAHDWNRSYVLEPHGMPVGAVVLLHGLTDSPYSLRHIAERYREHGFVAIGLRVPAHGTVPGALSRVQWQTWMAATRLAVREARRRIGLGKPLHLVGYSNGGALAVTYTLDSLEDPQLPRPDRIVLLSPMIGVSEAARYAGLAGLPALFPAFAKAAWLDLMPEFNPFKYNSFPVNAARQSYLMTDALHERLLRVEHESGLDGMPPVLAFQSVVDATVSAPAVLTNLFAYLPANGSEIVLFDVNRNLRYGPLLPASVDQWLSQLPATSQRYRTTVIANASVGSSAMVERSTAVGQTQAATRALTLVYPADMFSLSHVAMPFPTTDALYGQQPAPGESFGVHLGTLAPRGERGVLIVDGNFLLRASSNPFFPYLLERIEESIDGRVSVSTRVADASPATAAAPPQAP